MDIEPLVAALHKVLAPLLAVSSSRQQASVYTGNAGEALQTLAGYLEKADTRSLQWLQENTALIDTHHDDPAWSQLVKQITHFEFEQALASLQEITRGD